MVVVVGDVNSTLACALVAAQEHIPLAHVEAGLRSFDRTMPEEINRILTDAVSDLLFTTEESANHNLTQEGIAPARIHFVGNLMIDSLIGALELARRSPLSAQLGLAPHSYAVLTLHRPSNVDDVDQLTSTLSALLELAGRLPILFPAHPRTRARIAEARIHGVRCWTQGRIAEPGLWMMPPASYLDFLGIVEQSALVITDSGGIQEETTWLGIPCLTFRDSTERPATVSMGSNQVVGTDPRRLLHVALQILENGPTLGRLAPPSRPPLWDGAAAPRIVEVLREYEWPSVPSGQTTADLSRVAALSFVENKM